MARAVVKRRSLTQIQGKLLLSNVRKEKKFKEGENEKQELTSGDLGRQGWGKKSRNRGGR